MPLLVSLYSAFGAVDKVTKFYNTLLDNKIKRKTIRNNKSSSQEEDPQIKLLERQIKELKSDKRRLAKENKLLATSVSELTHYIKGMSNQNVDSDLLYSKSVFENQKNTNKKDDLDEN